MQATTGRPRLSLLCCMAAVAAASASSCPPRLETFSGARRMCSGWLGEGSSEV